MSLSLVDSSHFLYLLSGPAILPHSLLHISDAARCIASLALTTSPSLSLAASWFGVFVFSCFSV